MVQVKEMLSELKKKKGKQKQIRKKNSGQMGMNTMKGAEEYQISKETLGSSW